MQFLFKTPRAHKWAAAVCMAVNIGNIVVFNDVLGFFIASDRIGQGIFVALTHLATILALAWMCGQLTSMGMKMNMFIQMMAANGFEYDPQTREFRNNGKQP